MSDSPENASPRRLITEVIEDIRRLEDAVQDLEEVAAKQLAREAARLFPYLALQGIDATIVEAAGGIPQKQVVARRWQDGTTWRTNTVVLGADGVLRAYSRIEPTKTAVEVSEWVYSVEQGAVQPVEVLRALRRAIRFVYIWQAFRTAMLIKRQDAVRRVASELHPTAITNALNVIDDSVRLRLPFLFALYILTDGDPSEWRLWHWIGDLLGAGPEELTGVVAYLTEAQFVKQRTSQISITPLGIDAVEAALSSPDQATEGFPAFFSVVGDLQKVTSDSMNECLLVP